MAPVNPNTSSWFDANPDALRPALNCLPEVYLLVDAAECVVYANEAYERLSGYSSFEVEGQRLSDLIEPGVSSAGPCDVLCRSTRGYLATRACIRSLAGETGAKLRLVRLEEDSASSSPSQRLANPIELKGEFLARLSHELRTPLTAVQEGLDVVLEGFAGALNETQREFLELARRNVSRLNRLVTDTLALDALKQGRNRRPPERVDLALLVAQCRHRYQQIEVALPPAPVWVEADGHGIENVLDKLVQNALRFSPHTAVRVSLQCDSLDATVEVADGGEGIPSDRLSDIFLEFEQLSIGPGRTVGGLGLGLTIAKLIIEQHGGRIWAESQPGRGARFYFSLKTCKETAEKYQ